jgi:hypothetical protein
MSTTALRALLTTRCPDSTSPAERDALGAVTAELHTILAAMFTAMIRCQHVPEALRVERCIALWKQKGSPHDSNKYRGITVANVFGKLLQRVVASRIAPLLIAGLPAEQSAYQPGRTVVEGPYVLLVALQLAKAMREPLYVIQLDSVKAYDRLNRDLMLSRLARLGVVGPLLGFMEAELQQTRRYVQYGGVESHEWHDELGIKQGDVRSPLVYAAATAPFAEAVRAFAGAPGSGAGVRIVAELSESGGIARLFLIVFADDVTIIQIGSGNVQAILDCCHALSEDEVFEFDASETVVTGYSPSADAPAKLLDWTLGGLLVKVQRDVVVRHLGVYMGPLGPGTRTLGGIPSIESCLVGHRSKMGASARHKMLQGRRVLATGTFSGAERRQLFHIGPRSTLVWGRKLAWCVFWKAEWTLYCDWARQSVGVRSNDRVNMLAVFAEAGLLPPGVDHLRDAATFLDLLRTLPSDTPARVAFVAAVRLSAAHAGPRVRERPGTCPRAQLLLCDQAISAAAAMQWGFAQLGLSEYFGGLSDSALHAPWEPPPAPPAEPGVPPPAPCGPGGDLVSAAYRSRWPSLCAGSESMKSSYLQVRPVLLDDDWQLSVTPEYVRFAFSRLRLGAVRLHEWVQRHEHTDRACTWCPSAPLLTLDHVLVQCRLSQGPRQTLRSSLLGAVDAVVAAELHRIALSPDPSAHPDPAADCSVVLIRSRIVAGMCPTGTLTATSAEGRRVWGVFLRGGDVDGGGSLGDLGEDTAAPCPLDSRGDLSRLGLAIRLKFRHILPVYAHEIVRVVEGGCSPREVTDG